MCAELNRIIPAFGLTVPAVIANDPDRFWLVESLDNIAYVESRCRSVHVSWSHQIFEAIRGPDFVRDTARTDDVASGGRVSVSRAASVSASTLNASLNPSGATTSACTPYPRIHRRTSSVS